MEVLPNEMVALVFGWTDWVDALSISLVCWRWRTSIMSCLWRPLAQLRDPILARIVGRNGAQAPVERRDVWTAGAAARGYLDLLRRFCSPHRPVSPYACDAAIALGRLDVVDWAVAHGAPLIGRLCRLAARYGHLPILQWLRGRACAWDRSECMEAAIEHDHADIVEWMLPHIDAIHSEKLCAQMAAHGRLGLLQMIWSRGYARDEWVCTMAAKGGHLDVLQWARQAGCQWSHWTSAFAAIGGHLCVTQWLYANGCPWDEATATFAAELGHLPVLEWVCSMGCPWNRERCRTSALANDHVHVVAWIDTH